VSHSYLKNSSSCNITHIPLDLKIIQSLIKSDFIIKQNYDIHCHEGPACMHTHKKNPREQTWVNTHRENINVFINPFICKRALFEYYECLLFLIDPVSLSLLLIICCYLRISQIHEALFYMYHWSFSFIFILSYLLHYYF
jgi:hypothetical protein